MTGVCEGGNPGFRATCKWGHAIVIGYRSEFSRMQMMGSCDAPIFILSLDRKEGVRHAFEKVERVS